MAIRLADLSHDKEIKDAIDRISRITKKDNDLVKRILTDLNQFLSVKIEGKDYFTFKRAKLKSVQDALRTPNIPTITSIIGDMGYILQLVMHEKEKLEDDIAVFGRIDASMAEEKDKLSKAKTLIDSVVTYLKKQKKERKILDKNIGDKLRADIQKAREDINNAEEALSKLSKIKEDVNKKLKSLKEIAVNQFGILQYILGVLKFLEKHKENIGHYFSQLTGKTGQISRLADSIDMQSKTVKGGIFVDSLFKKLENIEEGEEFIIKLLFHSRKSLENARVLSKTRRLTELRDML